MKCLIAAMFAAFTVFISFADSAEARRGPSIPLPGLANEEIVKVLDLPDIPFLKRDDGKYIDLGYLHQGFGGKWVGYIDSEVVYVPLSEEALETLLKVSGVDQLPPVPKQKGGIGWMIVGAIGLLFLACVLFGKRKEAQRAPARSSPRAHPKPDEDEEESDLDWAHIDAELEKAAREIKRTSPASKGFGRRRA